MKDKITASADIPTLISTDPVDIVYNKLKYCNQYLEELLSAIVAEEIRKELDTDILSGALNDADISDTLKASMMTVLQQRITYGNEKDNPSA